MQNDKNTFGISKKSHRTRPFQVIAKNQNMGSEWKKQIDKTMNGWHGNGQM